MSRFNTKDHTNKKSSAISSTGETATNHYGVEGYKRDAKSELFLLAVSFMGGDANFYESSDARYDRLIKLSREAAVKHSVWFGDFVNWIRTSAMMRTVAGVMAVEGVMGRLATVVDDEKAATSQGTVNREIIDAACARADDPAEILAYYLSKYPKLVPQPIKNGLGDAVRRLYTERGYLRYAATTTSSVGMADVIRLCHPKPTDEAQSHLFNYITEWEHRGANSEGALAELSYLDKVRARRTLMDIAPEDRKEHLRTRFQFKQSVLRDAEMGWENISAWLGEMDREAWEAVIPNMGLMAMLRNLSNFDKVGIGDIYYKMVTDKLQNADEVRKSRALPMRFLSAYRHAPSLRWAWALETGLNHSLSNVPEIGGRNLILVDVSPSMKSGKISAKSDLTYFDAATIFGSVLAVKNPHSSLVQFGGSSDTVHVYEGESVLKVIEKFHQISYTDIPAAVRRWYSNHDRVIIITDEQSQGYSYGWGRGRYDDFMQTMNSVRSIVPEKAPIYTWNLAGFEVGHQPSNERNMHVFGGGFSDAAFGMIKYIEQGQKTTWPWELEN